MARLTQSPEMPTRALTAASDGQPHGAQQPANLDSAQRRLDELSLEVSSLSTQEAQGVQQDDAEEDDAADEEFFVEKFLNCSSPVLQVGIISLITQVVDLQCLLVLSRN